MFWTAMQIKRKFYKHMAFLVFLSLSYCFFLYVNIHISNAKHIELTEVDPNADVANIIDRNSNVLKRRINSNSDVIMSKELLNSVNIEPKPQTIKTLPLTTPDKSKRDLDPTTMKYKTRCYKTNYSNPDGSYTNHTPNGYIIEEKHFCKGEILILYFVQTAVHHSHHRNIIRKTWGSLDNIDGDRYKVVFILGRSVVPAEMAAVKAESDKYRDMVQADFIDLYKNLTYKHLYAMKWIISHCPQAKFIFKTDDDVLVNVFQVRNLVNEGLLNRKNFIYCKSAAKEIAIRNKRIKWYVSPEEWPDKMYPTLCKGFGYLMSADIVPKLYYCSMWRTYFWIDDVFVTGVVREAVNVEILHWWPGFDFDNLMPHHASHLVNDHIVYLDRTHMMPTLFKKVWTAALVQNNKM